MKALIAFGDKVPKVKTTEILGTSIELNITDIEQRYLYEDCNREPENIFVYRALARMGLCKTFLDVGANYGHEAILLVNDYSSIVLVEPNPRAVETLNEIFQNNKNVKILNVAIVSQDSPRELELKVPLDSSGLASFEESPLMRDKVETFMCKGQTLEECIGLEELSHTYIKIDIEGGEFKILQDAADDIMKSGAIVGFEALSRNYAKKCSSLLEGYTFYYGKFDFLADHGSLMTPSRIFKTLFGWKRSISVYKVTNGDFSNTPDNFSQVYCVPNNKVEAFEMAVRKMASEVKEIDLISNNY
ncbi:FkbM family methyltransferase [uncultured Arcticibacterium sp.]|uniref:FkbM family methyltransferase n=1 Tax=uncultured Arcticibacterium sp. TaxID=2173042 RepID=UPI0030FC4DD5